MKQVAQNSFSDGLNLDLHPIVTPNSVLTDNINGTFITYNGNEFCLQNDKGNIFKASLSIGFMPIGIKEHNGILYIVSCKEVKSENPEETYFVGEIGTYPGLNWDGWDHDHTEQKKDLDYSKYTPLGNCKINGASTTMTTTLFNFDLEHPVSIEIQDSYDGSVNLILTDNKNEPRLINSGFSVLPGGQYKFPKRLDDNNKGYTIDSTFCSQIKLIRNSVSFTHFELESVSTGGSLKGGNYTFYLKYSDNDENLSDIACQSGIIMITKGSPEFNDDNKLKNVAGTLMDEIAGKAIHLKVCDLDLNYHAFKLYYTREYSDTSGYLMTEGKTLRTTYKYNSIDTTIIIDGTELEDSIDIEELNINYHSVSTAKAQTQQADMLFLGNISTNESYIRELKDASLDVIISLQYSDIPVTLPDYDANKINNIGYADPMNVYYNVGYWPNEYYKLGIIYILEDGTTTNVYTVRGHTDLQFDNFTNQSEGYNDDGIFRFRATRYQISNSVYPVGFKASIPLEVQETLNKYNVVGYAIVRQKRHPKTLCQGVSIPVDTKLGLPLIPRRKTPIEDNNEWAIRYTDNTELYGLSESFITQDFKSNAGAYDKGYCLASEYVDGHHKPQVVKENEFINLCEVKDGSGDEIGNYHSFVVSNSNFKMHGVVSADAYLVKDVQNKLNGQFLMQPIYHTENGFRYHNKAEHKATYIYDIDQDHISEFFPDTYCRTGASKLTYIPVNTVSKVIDSMPHCTVVGNAASYTDFGVIESCSVQAYGYNEDDIRNFSLVRGHFMPYIYSEMYLGNESGIYNINTPLSDEELYTAIKNDQAPFYIVSNRIDIRNDCDIYRGDCYICRVWLRYNRNFIGSSKPENLIMENRWSEIGISRGESGKTFDDANWTKINLGDVNNVPLGLWLSYVCYSNYNLQIRSEDTNDVVTAALVGTDRSFVPCQTLSVLNDYKQEESTLLNAGYSITVGRVRYSAPITIPYSKNEYSTRVMFSNKHVNDAFLNGYRTFQGLSYKDYDKQYGEIVKLLPWKESLICVMEHGITLIPVNEKALIQTTTDQTIHIYGHGVLPDTMTLISADYGSKYADTIMKTPIGVYGIDTSAKKIWRFSEKQGFETLSDMKIESFLNENLDSEYLINLGTCNIRTHYNSFKGDLIFAWYYTKEGRPYSFAICFNERQGIWTTKYSWIPEVSENINGEFFSLQIGEDSNGQIGIYSHSVKDSKPTKWYGRQYPFEFEFVVSDPIGVHKIYENLQIISNNVQPEELQFEFIGDSYMFNKARLYHTVFEKPNLSSNRIYKNETAEFCYEGDPTKDETKYSKPNIEKSEKLGYKPFRNGSKLNDRDSVMYGEVIKTLNATEQYHLRIPQECRNVETWGRRLGNIHYKNDSWFATVEPIVYDSRLNDPNVINLNNDEVKWNSARIRDKWCKIRVRYSGEDLAVITAIKTIVNI